MSTSWRITTEEKDRTDIVSTSSQIIGATVINAPKGPKEFIFLNKGETQKVLDLFGYPSKKYPSIQDALDFVKTSSLWLASPYKDGEFGGVFVTNKGTVPFTKGVKTQAVEDLSAVPSLLDIGKGNGTITSYTNMLVADNRINKDSISLVKGETTSKITLSDENNNITDASGLLTEGSTLDLATGELNLVFTLAPTSEENISIEYTMNVSDTKFILFDHDMQKDDLQVKVVKSEEVDNALDIFVYRFNPRLNEYEELYNSPYTIGLNSLSKNNEGTNIFIENVLSESKQSMFTPLVIDEDLSTFIDDKSPISLGGGNRGSDVEPSDFATTYDALQDSTKYELKIVFDPMGYSEVAVKFDELRKNYQKYCRFEFCTKDIPASEIISDPATNGVVSDNRGLYCYCLTWGIHRDTYLGNDFLCSNMGLIASKLVRVLEIGGGVPAWIQNGGGLLGGAITKLNQRASEPELEKLNEFGFNPIVMDNKYGPMIEGWRTRQVKKTVYSFIGQSSLADTLIDLITKNVLPNTIGTLIDDTTFAVVRTGCNTILRTYSQWLDDFYVLCDSTNNTDESKNAQKLNVAVGVVFKGYASRVYFNFVTYKQGTKVEEELQNI